MNAAPKSISTPPGQSNSSNHRTSIAAHLGELERLLRQREGLFEEVFASQAAWSRVGWFLGAILLLSAVYGLTMGAMGFTQGFGRGLAQALTSAAKVPVLYLGSLAVCYPVLYVVLVLLGVRLSLPQTLALVLMALTLNSLILGSCAPIVVFFILTGSDYHFVKLLHVVVFAFSGWWAMMALWQGLRAMCEKSNLYPRQAIKILQVWILVFGFVGTQMAWSLRPFVGSPGLEYQVFRAGQKGNFYEAVWASAVGLAQKASDGAAK